MSIERKLKRIAKFIYNETKDQEWISGHGNNIDRLPAILKSSLNSILEGTGWVDDVKWYVSPTVNVIHNEQTQYTLRVVVSWNPYINRHCVRVFVDDSPIYPIFAFYIINNSLFGGWSWKVITQQYTNIFNRIARLEESKKERP